MGEMGGSELTNTHLRSTKFGGGCCFVRSREHKNLGGKNRGRQNDKRPSRPGAGVSMHSGEFSVGGNPSRGKERLCAHLVVVEGELRNPGLRQLPSGEKEMNCTGGGTLLSHGEEKN